MRIELTGAADVMKKLSDLGKAGDDICSRALYDGMSATADALRGLASSRRVDKFATPECRFECQAADRTSVSTGCATHEPAPFHKDIGVIRIRIVALLENVNIDRATVFRISGASREFAVGELHMMRVGLHAAAGLRGAIGEGAVAYCRRGIRAVRLPRQVFLSRTVNPVEYSTTLVSGVICSFTCFEITACHCERLGVRPHGAAARAIVGCT